MHSPSPRPRCSQSPRLGNDTRNPLNSPTRKWLTGCALWLMLLTPSAILWPTHSAAQPSQRPLFVTSTGAKPNILVSLDNSSSMALPYPDDYRVPVAGDRAKDPAHFWAQRSSDVNPLYYNPRVKYEPRVDVNGRALPITDGIAFVSNEKGT